MSLIVSGFEESRVFTIPWHWSRQNASVSTCLSRLARFSTSRLTCGSSQPYDSTDSAINIFEEPFRKTMRAEEYGIAVMAASTSPDSGRFTLEFILADVFVFWDACLTTCRNAVKLCSGP